MLRQQVVEATLGDKARNSNLYMTVVLATGHLIDELQTRLANAGPVKTSI